MHECTDHDANRIIVATIIFGMLMLLSIATAGIRLAEKLIDMNTPITIVQPSSIHPAVTLPNPRQYYFIDCANGDRAMIVTKKESVFFFICEEGKWIGANPL